jgi:hypothetical protein
VGTAEEAVSSNNDSKQSHEKPELFSELRVRHVQVIEGADDQIGSTVPKNKPDMK